MTQHILENVAVSFLVETGDIDEKKMVPVCVKLYIFCEHLSKFRQILGHMSAPCEKAFLAYANGNGRDQPVHPRDLIGTSTYDITR